MTRTSPSRANAKAVVSCGRSVRVPLSARRASGRVGGRPPALNAIRIRGLSGGNLISPSAEGQLLTACVDASIIGSTGRWLYHRWAIQALARCPHSIQSGRRPAAWVASVSGRLYRGIANEGDGSDEGQRTEPDQGKVVGVQKGQTTGMSVSTSALAVIVTSLISNEAIDDMAPKMAMIRSPSSKPRDAEL